MAIEVFNRYEHKYMLDKETYEAVIDIVEKHMEIDAHNENRKPYTIANIYYDTQDDLLIRTSLSKPEYKEKLRLRAYGVPQKDSKVFLEIKKKYKGLVNKRRTKIALSDAYDFVETGNMPESKGYMNEQVVKEIDYFIHLYDLRPKLYLAYDRIAYFERENADLRISFDTNIRSRRYDVRLENGDFGEELLCGEYYLMEIKTSYAKPLWLVDMLSTLNIKRQSFSKYGTEFKKNINKSLAV
ncbi:MAG: polyphosphate polymerase domain-containing protein [Monoglobaceae bacterium]